jgi:16S rRNA (uracil1498-N3)-methyltransferase
LDETAVLLDVQWRELPPMPSAVDLLLALPRPKMLRKILASVTSIGVKRIVLINSFRVEKSYFDSPFLSEASIERELCNGLSQGRDTILPHVVIRNRFKPFIEDELSTFWPSNTRKLVAHPDAPKDLFGTLPVPTRDPAVIAIGPEGGWIPYEVEMLESHGFTRFSAGARILRVDTAVSFLLGQLELLWHRPVSSRAPVRE